MLQVFIKIDSLENITKQVIDSKETIEESIFSRDVA